MAKKASHTIRFSRISPYNKDGSVRIWHYKKTSKRGILKKSRTSHLRAGELRLRTAHKSFPSFCVAGKERAVSRIKAFKPLTWLLIAFYSICMLIAFVGSVRATHDSLQAETRNKTQVILRLQKTAQELQSVKGQSAGSESQVKAQTDQINQLKAKIDELNKQLQAKLNTPSPVAVAPSGFGGMGGGGSAYVGSYGNNYAPLNCTAYVASRVRVPASMGNANQWDDYARAHGITVSSVPVVGEVAQADWMSYLGHVSVVEAINGDGTVTISEENYYGLGIIDTRVTPISDWVYIYF